MFAFDIYVLLQIFYLWFEVQGKYYKALQLEYTNYHLVQNQDIYIHAKSLMADRLCKFLFLANHLCY